MDDISAPQNRASSSRVPFFSKLIATGLFTGYAPFAPGTAGSLAGLFLYSFIPGMDTTVVLSIAIIVFFGLGVPSASAVARVVGHQLSRGAKTTKDLFQPGKQHPPDPSIVVIDEVVGMWISLLLLPKNIAIAAAAFLAFRVFDIVKPYPARQLERYPNGWGIMLDDVVAGVYANIVVQVLVKLFPHLIAQ